MTSRQCAMSDWLRGVEGGGGKTWRMTSSLLLLLLLMVGGCFDSEGMGEKQNEANLKKDK